MSLSDGKLTTVHEKGKPHMARITYQDSQITEYDDGTEEVRFTEEEWAIMLADPAFGYVCSAGRHRIDGGERNWSPAEGCMLCFSEREAAMDDYYEGASE